MLVNPREVRVQLQQQATGSFECGPLFANVDAPLRSDIPWQHTQMQYVALDGKAKSRDFDASFAVGMTQQGLDVVVRVADPKWVTLAQNRGLWNGDSVQFALDPDGSALFGNQVEFVAASEDGHPLLLKTITPYLGGDLPNHYTPANEPVKYARIAVDRDAAGRLVYRIRIQASELYPFALDASRALRFSLLINNNDGQGRAGYLQWAAGIGRDKKPVLYGTLKPVSQGP